MRAKNVDEIDTRRVRSYQVLFYFYVLSIISVKGVLLRNSNFVDDIFALQNYHQIRFDCVPASVPS